MYSLGSHFFSKHNDSSTLQCAVVVQFHFCIVFYPSSYFLNIEKYNENLMALCNQQDK